MFTSEQVRGLIVFSDKKEKAIDMLPGVIEELVRRNHGFDCVVELGSHDVPDPGKPIGQPDFAVIKRAAVG